MNWYISDVVCKIPYHDWYRNLFAQHSLGTLTIVKGRPEEVPEDGYMIASRGGKWRADRCSVTETGYWHKASYCDKLGLFQDCSINSNGAMDRVLAYKASESAQDIVRRQRVVSSKYRQKGANISWDGVVLACQKPTDRAVLDGCPDGSEDYYYSFIEGACKHYGKCLFLKLHPMIHDERQNNRIREIASEHGCSCDYATVDVINRCKFVLTFNSGFVVDCWMREVRVAQFAPGVFHRTGGTMYTDGEYPDDVFDTQEIGQRLLDFMIWKYSFCDDMSPDDYVMMFRVFESSPDDDLFPLPEALSYAANCSPTERTWSR